ncbi:hypothetical protein [Stenotrophomonas indicatrix]|uniref:hypothetical protein n=1 Tax=Stenotrophomonas indicatrix TaxID=2045451 RepID=UPI000FD90D25|nr:hypothetical protein [Stenotrophomonas indicatrix]
MSNRIAGKALSSLTLIIAGTAAASAAPVHSQVNTAQSGLNALTAIDLDAHRGSEFSAHEDGVLVAHNPSDSLDTCHPHHDTGVGTRNLTEAAVQSDSRFDA